MTFFMTSLCAVALDDSSKIQQKSQIEAQMGQAKKEIKKLKLLEKIETNKLYKNQQRLEYNQHSLQKNKKQSENHKQTF